MQAECVLLSDVLRAILVGQGYRHLADRAGVLTGVHSFVYTFGLMVGVHVEGYERRYCYEFEIDAILALNAWDGHGHPGGPWIKCKGLGIDMLNPDFTDKHEVAAHDA